MDTAPASIPDRDKNKHRAIDGVSDILATRFMRSHDPAENSMASPEKQFQRAVAAYQDGKFVSARKLLAKLQQEVGAAPPVVHLNGFIELELGTPERAVTALQQAAKLFPNDANVFNGLGVAYRRCRRPSEALNAFTRALQLDAKRGDFHTNLGNLLSQIGRVAEAIQSYQTALILNPNNADATTALATDLDRINRHDEAIALLEQFITRAPENVSILLKLAGIEQGVANIGAAERWYIAARALEPENPKVLAGLLSIRVLRGDVTAALKAENGSERKYYAVPAVASTYVHTLNYAPATTPADLRDAAKRIRSKFSLPGPAPTVRRANRPLRVGIVSRKFGSHPVNFFTAPLIRESDPDAITFELFASSVPEHVETARIRGLAGAWHDLTAFSIEEKAQIIRDRELDIAITPTGHEEGDLLDMFQARLAPVQLAAFAVFCTTGIRTIDGFITDRHQTPAGAEDDFTETVIRMPDGYVCFNPPEDIPALTEPDGDEIVFGSFNNLAKVCDFSLALWSRVLAQQANSRLFLKAHALADEECRKSFIERITQAGIDPDRVILEGPSPRIEALKAYRRIDVALDPLAYSGGVTTLEALWMGVPVITLPGTTFARRHSLSHLTVAGLEQWVATSADDYVAKALDAAERVRKEKNFRQSVRDAIRRSPTSDAKAYARDFEHAVRNFSR